MTRTFTFNKNGLAGINGQSVGKDAGQVAVVKDQRVAMIDAPDQTPAPRGPSSGGNAPGNG